MKVLVTGGAGFIGSHIVDDLLAAGCRVVVLDNFSSGRWDNLRPVLGDVELIEGDVRNGELLLQAARGCDVISHQAAQLEISTCLKDPALDFAINGQGTLNVLQAAHKNGVGRVVYASSACVYGQAQEAAQTEQHPLEPNWAYGVSKHCGELYAAFYGRAHGLRTVGLRYAIVYGVREWYGRALTVFLHRALHRQPPVLWGRGSAVRDFVNVRDAVRLHHAALFSHAVPAPVLNVSTGVGTSIGELAERVRELTDMPAPAIYESIAEGEKSAHVEGRTRLPAELQRMVLDNQLAKSLFGWEPSMDLATGLREEWEWIHSNPHAWSTMRY